MVISANQGINLYMGNNPRATGFVAGDLPGYGEFRTAYDYPGWIAAAALCGAPGDWLPRAREGEPLDEARAYLGTPYLWGGMSERGIDCSGLVHMAWHRLGRLVPRDSDQQAEAGTPVDEPRYGDLAVYGREQATHIAFWLGDGRILHATGRQGVNAVVEEPLTNARGDDAIRYARF